MLSQPLTLLMTVIITHMDQEVPGYGQVHKSPAYCHLSLPENKSTPTCPEKGE